MSVRTKKSKPRTTREHPRLTGERVRERPTERAFVIQFEPVKGARSRLRGRIELVASGEAIRFRSLKQLVRFMVGTLRRRAAASSLMGNGSWAKSPEHGTRCRTRQSTCGVVDSIDGDNGVAGVGGRERR